MNNSFPWFGSKARLAKWVIKLMPKHDGYAELFGGSGAILLRKPPSKIEIFNDINEGITTFFRVVRDANKLKKLQQKLLLTPYNESDYKAFLATWQNEPNEIEKAFKWYYVAQLSFSGIFGKGPRLDLGGNGGTATTISMYLSSIENLNEVYSRVRGVQILNRNWKKCISLFGHKEFLIYLDPPYIPETRIDGYYPNEMSPNDHKELAETIVGAKAMVILSGYGHSIYDNLLKNKWKKLSKDVKITCSHDSRGGFTKTSRVECLYLNKHICES